MFLLMISSISQSMEESDTPSPSIAEEYEETGRHELTVLIRTSSLKKQVAIKIAKFIAAGSIDRDKLQILPIELIECLNVYEQIESLNPDNPIKCDLPKGLQTNFYFLKSIYLIEDDCYLFYNLNLLIDGLKQIDLSKTDGPTTNPILIIAEIIAHQAEPYIDERTDTPLEIMDCKFQKLVQYCVEFNNLSLLAFLNLVREIPLMTTCLEQTPIDSSMLDLACLSPESNPAIIEFLRSETKRRGMKWKTITSDRAILRGILSPHKEKRIFLINLATKSLDINSNQYIGFPVEKCTPVILAVAWGYEDAFEFFLKQFKPKSNDQINDISDDILKQFSRKIIPRAQQDKAQLIESKLIMLDQFEEYLAKENPKFAEQKEHAFKETRTKLTNMLKKLA